MLLLQTTLFLFSVTVLVNADSKSGNEPLKAFRPFFKNGRVLGGMVGHWKQDFSSGQSEAENAGMGIPGNPNVSIQWYNQKLDHFNGADTRYWNQTYWMNNQFYKPGGPAFIMIGGEGPTSRHWIDINEGTPDWLKNAKTFGAMCFQLEHRFYGKSWPLADMSTKNLQYLSSRQALADVASFINGMKAKYPILQNAKWVTFGGSYSGALSGWFRLKYPHMVVGAVATSAPVLAQVDFRQYLEVVQMSLSSYSPMCAAMVKMGDTAVRQLMMSQSGMQTLQQKMRLCQPLTSASKWDIMNLYSSIAGNFMGVVQYNKDNRSCLDYSYTGMINFLRQTNFTAGDASWRLWTWQTCTEFGYYQDSNSTMTPFSNTFPLSFSIKQCADIFGQNLFTMTSIANNIRQTNYYYGGLNFKGTNVILPNGSLDPWHALGILQTQPGSSAKSAFIMGTAHCANMYPPRQADLIGLNQARQQITQSLHSWLGM